MHVLGPVYASDFATPDFLRDLYGVPRGLRVQHPNNSQCVTEFLEQYYSQDDLVSHDWDFFFTKMPSFSVCSQLCCHVHICFVTCVTLTRFFGISLCMMSCDVDVDVDVM